MFSFLLLSDQKNPSTSFGGSSGRGVFSGNRGRGGKTSGSSGNGGSTNGVSGKGGSTSGFLGRGLSLSENRNPLTGQPSTDQGSLAGSASITSILARQLGRGSDVNVYLNLPCVTTGILNLRGQSLTGSCRRVSRNATLARQKRQVNDASTYFLELNRT